MNKVFVLLAATVFLTGCQTINNTVMEKMFGMEKRELLKKSVEGVSKEQKEAQEEFKDAMTRLKELYSFDGGELEKVYNKLKSSYDNAQGQADKVNKRIANMESIAKSMFSEWNKEIKTYDNKTFAANSRRQFTETKSRYEQLSRAVKESEQSMQPVLKQLSDHVLYLKHNLNAASIGSLRSEATSIELQVDQLIRTMNSSISEADAFLQTFQQ